MEPERAALISLRWPLPAVLAWVACWVAYLFALKLGLSGADSAGIGAMLGLLLSLRARSAWRRLWVVLGFPASLLLMQAATLPAWVWLVPALALLLLYPLRAWRDAPLFPTPPDALNDLPQYASLPPAARILDAGCGLGQGLEALRQAYPLAKLEGIEWSRLLAWACARRCPWADVRRGDFWQADWSSYELVSMFQRPESMPQALEKARRELRPGAWLVSLEFELPGIATPSQIETTSGKPVWIYAAETIKNGDESTPHPEPR